MSDQVEVSVQNEDESWDRIEGRFFESYKASIECFDKSFKIDPDNYTRDQVATLKNDIMTCSAMLAVGIRGLISLMQTSREVASWENMQAPVVVGETA